MSSASTPPENPSSPPNQRASVHERRLHRQQGKPNRSQVKAAQTRAEQTALAPAATSETASQVSVKTPDGAAVKLTPAQRRALERGTVARGTGMPLGMFNITRDQEMVMIREDLHRLLIIAGLLLLAMLALLFLID